MNWIFGDNINTDLITPGRYNITTDPRDLASIVFVEYRPEFAKKVKKGDFLIAGHNFGCGSSRETAAIALRSCGLQAIIAQSFARIFYRNCINQGLLTIIADTKDIEKNDRLKLDIKSRLLKNITKKTEQPITISTFVIKIYKKGGIIPYIRKEGISAIYKLEAM